MFKRVNIALVFGGILLIIAAVPAISPIPEFAKERMHDEEISAMASMLTIFQAELQYNSIYQGFSCSLESLGGGSDAGQPSPLAAHLLPSELASGKKAGYTFSITDCTKVIVKGKQIITGYKLVAIPRKSGLRGFCTDGTNKVMADPMGGKNCTDPVE